MQRLQKTAFSLVELSIVLVILGLLVGGVLSGQSLIRAAAIRSVVTDVQRYSAAALTFREKYFALPGDMANATSFWGSAGGDGSNAACQNTNSGGAPTCNGNGDGIIIGNAVGNDENARFWQHLNNAGLVEGRYTGVSAGGAVPGVNYPATKLGSTTFWYVGTGNAGYGGTSNFAQPAGQQIRNSGNTALALTPQEAWNIDTKLDDGLPGTGKAIGYKGTTSPSYPCTSAAGVAPPGDAGATYTLTNTDMICYITFYNTF